MLLSSSIIGILWIVFGFYWLISAVTSKRTIRTKTWWYGGLIRLLLIVLVIILFQAPWTRTFFVSNNISKNPIADAVGVILCATGLAFAVWARMHLGKNWGMPMSLKENPELIMTGPYKIVRHPIYSGVILAMLGSAFAFGWTWIIILIFFGIYFGAVSTRKEEQIMMQQFPNEYSEYMKRTKSLIPFIW